MYLVLYFSIDILYRTVLERDEQVGAESLYKGSVKKSKNEQLGHAPRGFNDSVNIPESCDFLSQFDILSIIFRLLSYILFCRHLRFE